MYSYRGALYQLQPSGLLVKVASDNPVPEASPHQKQDDRDVRPERFGDSGEAFDPIQPETPEQQVQALQKAAQAQQKTKTINGVVYRLNDHSRWERADKAKGWQKTKAAPKQKMGQPKDKSWQNADSDAAIVADAHVDNLRQYMQTHKGDVHEYRVEGHYTDKKGTGVAVDLGPLTKLWNALRGKLTRLGVDVPVLNVGNKEIHHESVGAHQIAKIMGVSVEEGKRSYNALMDYTHDSDQMIAAQRSGSGSPSTERSIAAMNNFLAKAPKFDGAVHRGMAFNSQADMDKFMSQLDSGFQSNSYTSWSSNADIAHQFANSLDDETGKRKPFSIVMVQEQNQSGVSVRPFSLYRREAEVVCPQGVKLRSHPDKKPQWVDNPHGGKTLLVHVQEF